MFALSSAVAARHNRGRPRTPGVVPMSLRNPIQRVLCWWCMVGCSVGWPIPAPGALSQSTPEYIIDVWQTEDGLPQNSVNAIAQTPDGYLWLATFNGLARFDGVAFKVFDPQNTPELP